MTNTPPRLRINRLEIQNYKKIDHLKIEFPLPLMEGDPDIFILGSKNGGGKTSVLECCSLITFLNLCTGGVANDGSSGLVLALANNLIQGGATEALIKVSYENFSSQRSYPTTVHISHKGKKLLSEKAQIDFNVYPKVNFDSNWPGSMFSGLSEPLIVPPLLHFNSYRKVSDLNPELGMITNSEDIDIKRRQSFAYRRGLDVNVSSFKQEVVKALMGRASLFEGFNEKESEATLSQLNELIRTYCGGEVERLQLLPNNTVDLRIKLRDYSFSFNGLSSGQKEMISTLFLIWKNTLNVPSIVLIDEPELHLNAEWHSDFVYQLHRFAPNNQYIIATHSEHIFRSVNSDRRALLVPSTTEEV